MKKDREIHQHAPESTTADEPKISSATLTLQLLNKGKETNKEEQKKASAAEAAKVRCRTCFKEIYPKRLCFGHGGGGAGGSASSDKTSEETAGPVEDKSLTKTDQIVETTAVLIDKSDSDERHSESAFDAEIIAELIAKGLLLVDSNRESLTLTIKLLCEPKVLTEEQRNELKKFMEAIIKEFNAFKEENHLSADCVKTLQDENGNIYSIRISMPTLTLYDAFIQRLASNLVSIPGSKVQEQHNITEDKSFAPNPLSMEPRPSSTVNPPKHEEVKLNMDIDPKKAEKEEQEIISPSPFNMKPW